MALWTKFLSLVIFMVCTIIGLLIFTRGFLLSRVAILDKSDNSKNSTIVPQYTKVVILVIDALRHDFVEVQRGSTEYYHNKLPYLQSLLTERPESTKLYKFIADPPTTTMQRLKGLTTGSLPTFVDAGSNFASSEVSEDSIIYQLARHHKPIVFMGDDTWESLFPGRFNRSFPYPSFDVQDLHTVDRGVKSHLLSEILRTDWTVIIGHLLGVDHCGHRFGPNHPAMSEKLKEMNELIKSVVETISNDTLLVILGDHGMTPTGDHGSDSPLEVQAALVLFSKSATWPLVSQYDEVSQIDLVPTLSLLLGVPVPYSNLGSLIADVFHRDTVTGALRLNYQQIYRYLQHYSLISTDLPRSELARLNEISNSLNFTKSPEQLKSKYADYAKRARLMCQNVWAKFDDSLMAIGLLTVFSIYLIRLAIVLGLIEDRVRPAVDISTCVLTLVAVVLAYLNVILTYSVSILTILSLLILAYCSERKSFQCSKIDLFSLLVAVLQGMASLSNSFLVNEDKVTYFLLQTMLLSLWVFHTTANLRSQTKKSTSKADLYRLLCFPSTILLMLLSIALSLSFFFNACREEQTNCKVSPFLTSLSSIHPDLVGYKNLRFFVMAVPCAFLPSKIISSILKTRGNLNGSSPLALLVWYGFPTLSIFLILHWTICATLLSDQLPVWQQVFAAMSVYLLTVVAIVISFLFPLSIYTSSRAQRVASLADKSVPTLYHYMKLRLSHDKSESPLPLVYGLGTAISANYVILACALTYLLMMLGGDGMAAAQLLTFLSLLIFADLAKAWTTKKTDVIPLRILVCYSLLSKHFFYYSGHQPTMPNIRWEAAFQGLSQDSSAHRIIPAMLLFSSTFSSQLVFTCALPLLIVVNDSCQYFYESLLSSPERSITGIGEITLVQQLPSTENRLYHLYTSYLLVYLTKTFFSLLSAAILRRHLMVWKIFAPAFIYESVSFILVCLVACVSYLLFTRIVFSLSRFIKDKELSHAD